MYTDESVLLSQESFLAPPLLRSAKVRPKGQVRRKSEAERHGKGQVRLLLFKAISPGFRVSSSSIVPGTLQDFLFPYCTSSSCIPFMALRMVVQIVPKSVNL